MSVLETFYYLFKADSKDAEKGLASVEKKAHQTASVVGKLEHEMKAMFMEVGAAVGAYMALESIKEHTMQAAESMVALSEASNRIGMPVAEMDAWEKSVKMGGGSSEEFRSTLKGLAADIAMVKTKGTSRKIAFFAELGIDESKLKDPTEALEKLNEKFHNLTEAEALGMGTKMGIDEYTIELLRKAPEEMQKLIAMQKKMGVVTEEDKKKILEYDDVMDLHEITMQNAWRRIAMAVMPVIAALTEAFDAFVNGIHDHWGIIEGIGILLGGSAVIGGIMAFVSAIRTLSLWSVICAAAQAIMAAPAVLLIALYALLGAAFLLLCDDIQNWVDGNGSAIGDVLGDWQTFKKDMLSIFADITQGIGDYWNRMIQNIVDGVEKAASWIKKLKEAPIEAGKDLLSGVGGVGNDLAMNAKNFVKSNFVPEGISDLATASFGAAQSTIFNSGTGVPQGGAKNTAVQIGDVTVNTQATDGSGTAEAFSSELTTHINNAIAAHDDGVEK